MPVSETNTVDGMGIDRRTGAVLMHIWEARDWTDPLMLLEDLEKKILAYLRFVTEGQIDEHPEFTGRPVEIQVFFQYSPPPEANNTFRRLRDELTKRGIGFTAFHGDGMGSPVVSFA